MLRKVIVSNAQLLHRSRVCLLERHVAVQVVHFPYALMTNKEVRLLCLIRHRRHCLATTNAHNASAPLTFRTSLHLPTTYQQEILPRTSDLSLCSLQASLTPTFNFHHASAQTTSSNPASDPRTNPYQQRRSRRRFMFGKQFSSSLHAMLLHLRRPRPSRSTATPGPPPPCETRTHHSILPYPHLSRMRSRCGD